MKSESILILGAKSDIAKSLAEVYAKNGFDVQLACRNAKEFESFRQHISVKYDVNAELYEFDVNTIETHETCIKNLSDMPEVLVSAIGVLGDQDQAENDSDHSLSIINTNFSHLICLLNRFANLFEERGSGCIVGISSVAGDRGRKSNYMYGSAKAGFTAYLSGLRNRLVSSGVHVMTVKPGFVDTQMTKDLDLPAALTAQPEQVAQAIYKGVEKGKNSIYVLWFWRWIMLIIKLIPESIFKKLNL